MIRRGRTIAMLVAAAALSAGALSAYETHRVRVAVPFAWPIHHAQALAANGLPNRVIRDFFNDAMSRTRGYWVPPGTPLMRIYSFRFVRLERAAFYLVVRAGNRWVQTYVLVPEKGEVSLTDMQTVLSGDLPLAMATPDLGGNGVHELVTAESPTGYPGPSAAPIYWYTIWEFRGGEPQDVSADYPDFYRQVVIPPLAYLGRLLTRLQAQGTIGTRLPLAEIAYVRLKYRRDVLGQPTAGLRQALAWAGSKDVNLLDLGIFSLADIPGAAARNALLKLEQRPADRDLIKLLLVRQARLSRRTPSGR